MSVSGWIGVDLDGTLAEYGGWKGSDHIGDPIPLMADRVRRWIADGVDVRVFTARASGPRGNPGEPQTPADASIVNIQAWTKRHFGVELPVTCQKDYAMVEVWDDRAVQVIPNTGRRADGGE